jgi:hypothetical protein
VKDENGAVLADYQNVLKDLRIVQMERIAKSV